MTEDGVFVLDKRRETEIIIKVRKSSIIAGDTMMSSYSENCQSKLKIVKVRECEERTASLFGWHETVMYLLSTRSNSI